ncbi:hypothetical protein CHS0354_007875 [Potamilus streckersoni]|uniref:Uncharacterized protein n=1 Tax=Potamilus streckersoni TaxID=2493646 RepID=A0AAE0W522_9BIVA|nr:hypothetical protein CHS0354_007875 [Potamilus streckersoni]
MMKTEEIWPVTVSLLTALLMPNLKQTKQSKFPKSSGLAEKKSGSTGSSHNKSRGLAEKKSGSTGSSHNKSRGLAEKKSGSTGS